MLEEESAWKAVAEFCEQVMAKKEEDERSRERERGRQWAAKRRKKEK